MPDTYFLLKEDGFKILQEDGSSLKTKPIPAAPTIDEFVSGVANGFGSTPPVVNISKPPNTVAGDYLIAQTIGFGRDVSSVPSGWTLFTTGEIAYSGVPLYMRFYYKLAGGSEPATYQFAGPAPGGSDNASLTVYMSRVSGAASPPVAETMRTESGSSILFPSIETTVTNTLVLHAGFFLDLGAGPNRAWATSVPEGTNSFLINSFGNGFAWSVKPEVGPTPFLAQPSVLTSHSPDSAAVAWAIAFSPAPIDDPEPEGPVVGVATLNRTLGAMTSSSAAEVSGPFTTVILTSGSTWVVPGGVTRLRVEAIGGGSGGGASGFYSGGAGGAYARINSLTVTPGDPLPYQIGAGSGPGNGNVAGDTWFANSAVILAKGGGSAGGSQANSVGDITYAGGNGDGMGGGGGAAGPNGTGGNAASGYGGAGDAGMGGAGGAFGGSAASNGTGWTATSNGAVAGSGGGGGGAGPGGAAGLYGGGGGGISSYGGKTGSPGVIVLRFNTPAAGISGTLAKTLGSTTVVSAGQVVSPPSNGTLVKTLGAATVSSAGSVVTQAGNRIVLLTEAGDRLIAENGDYLVDEASSAVTSVTGSVNRTLGTLTAVSAGTVVYPPRTGTLTQTLGAASVSASGTVSNTAYRAWTPGDLAVQPINWWDADSLNALGNNAEVTTWSDAGTQNNAFTAGTATKPRLKVGAYNGHSAITRTQNAQWMSTGTNASISGSNTRSIFIKAAHGSNGNANLLGSSTVQAEGGVFDMMVYGTEFIVHAFGGGNDTIGGVPVQTVSTGTLHTMNARHVGGVTATSVDGAAFDSFNMNLAAATTAPWTLGKGGYSQLDGTLGTMDTAEIIILNYNPTDAERYQIEGYLAHKYGTQNLLPSGHAYKSSAPMVGVQQSDATLNRTLGAATVVASGSVVSGATPWTPSDTITNVWLDVSDPATLSFTSYPLIDTITDKSNDARTTTITGGFAPDHIPNAINGRAAAYFLSDRIEFTPINAGASVTAYFVYRGETPQTLAILLGSNNTTMIPIGASGSASNTEVFRSINTNTVTVRKDGAPTTWANRGQAHTDINATQANTLLTIQNMDVSDKIMYLGAGPFSYFFRGYIGEFVMVPASISSGDSEKIEGYLAHKWGLAANLPAEHPYKAAAPTNGGGVPAVALGNLIQTLGTLTGSSQVSVEAIAASAITLGLVTSAGSITTSITGSTSKALGGLTASAATSISITATASPNLGGLGRSSAGSVSVGANLIKTLGPMTGSSSTTSSISAQSITTLGSLTGISAGFSTTNGSLNRTLGAASVYGVITTEIVGSSSRTLEPMTTASSTGITVRGQGSATFGALTGSAAVTIPAQGDLNQSLGQMTVSAYGDSANNGYVNATLGAATASSTAVNVVSGNTGRVLEPMTASGQAQATITAQISQTLGALTGVSETDAEAGGSSASTLGAMTVASSVSVVVRATSNNTLGEMLADSDSIAVPNTNAYVDATLQPMGATASAVSIVGGSTNATLGGLAGSSSGVVPLTATMTRTLGSMSAQTDVDVAVIATVNRTLGSIIPVIATNAIGTASMSQTLGAMSGSSTAIAPIGVSLNRTLGGLSVWASSEAPPHRFFSQIILPL